MRGRTCGVPGIKNAGRVRPASWSDQSWRAVGLLGVWGCRVVEVIFGFLGEVDDVDVDIAEGGKFASAAVVEGQAALLVSEGSEQIGAEVGLAEGVCEDLDDDGGEGFACSDAGGGDTVEGEDIVMDGELLCEVVVVGVEVCDEVVHADVAYLGVKLGAEALEEEVYGGVLLLKAQGDDGTDTAGEGAIDDLASSGFTGRVTVLGGEGGADV